MKSNIIKSNRRFTVLKYIFLIIYAAISIYPLIWMVLYSFKNNEEIFSTNPFGLPLEWQFENYVKAITEFDFFSYFSNSVIVAIFSVSICILLSLMFAYAVTRMVFRLSSFLRSLVITGLFIPMQIIMIPLVVLTRDLNLSNTLTSIILPYIGFGIPFSVLVLVSFYSDLPKELEEAACIDGANIYHCYFRIILPLMKPSIACLVVYQFMTNWNELSLALVLLQREAVKTLPLGILTFTGQFSTEWGPMGAVLVISSIPVVLLYILFSDQMEKAMAIGSSVKG